MAEKLDNLVFVVAFLVSAWIAYTELMPKHPDDIISMLKAIWVTFMAPYGFYVIYQLIKKDIKRTFISKKN